MSNEVELQNGHESYLLGFSVVSQQSHGSVFFNYVTAAGKTPIRKSESHSKSLTPRGIQPQKCQPRRKEKTDKKVAGAIKHCRQLYLMLGSHRRASSAQMNFHSQLSSTLGMASTLHKPSERWRKSKHVREFFRVTREEGAPAWSVLCPPPVTEQIPALLQALLESIWYFIGTFFS